MYRLGKVEVFVRSHMDSQRDLIISKWAYCCAGFGGSGCFVKGLVGKKVEHSDYE